MLEETDLEIIQEKLLKEPRVVRESAKLRGGKPGNYSEKDCVCGAHHGGAKSNLNHHSTRIRHHIRYARQKKLY